MKRNRQHVFQRVSILNRGEPALRFIRALREYNLERDVQMKAVSFYTNSDQYAPFVRQADEAVCLGEAMRTRSDGSSISAYCDHDFIIQLLKENECDAVWPGWGFVSEDPEFVRKLEAEGIHFIGPSSDAMFQLGDKTASKYMAEACEVPLAPWAEIRESDSATTIQEHGDRIGYPLMVKASAGGGGRGIIKVKKAKDLIPAIKNVREQVAKIFGQGGILIEKCVMGARHVEVQIVVNHEGESFALGVRDCSIQRKNQKVIEEAPSPVLPKDVEKKLCEASARLAGHAGYKGAGTCEYLYEPESGLCTFLEVNSRLQVEHTITELIVGCDLVKAQLDIAMNVSWRPPVQAARGHAIELRVNAENPEKDFQPAPGILRIFRSPSGPGVRVDSGVVEGMEIPPHFDSMIAKIIAWAPTRKQAIARVLRACKELEAVVEDGATNQAFLCDVLQHEQFISGKADTGWLDRAMVEGGVSVMSYEPEALISASILEAQLQQKSELTQFFSQVQDGIPQLLPKPEGRRVELRLRGRAWQMMVYGVDKERFVVGTEDSLHEVLFQILSPGVAELRMGGARHKVLYSYGSSGINVEVDGGSHLVERAAGGVIKSPTPAVVVSIQVEVGEDVKAGDRICTLEAMKMEMGVVAPEDGQVKAVLCRPNEQVSVGQPLLLIEPNEEEGSVTQVDAAALPTAPPRPYSILFEGDVPYPALMDKLDVEQADLVIGDVLDQLRRIMLGYDVSSIDCKRIESLFDQDFSKVEHPERWMPIMEALEIFADASVILDRNILLHGESESAMPADVAFYDFCRRCHDGESGVLPQLKPLMEKALIWFGISSLDATDSLRRALLRLAMANNYSETRHHLCSSLLRTMIHLYELGISFPDSLRETLLSVASSAKNQFPFVRDNALQAEYVLFERQKYAIHARGVAQILQGAFVEIANLDPTHRMVRMTMNRLALHPQALQKKLLERIKSGEKDQWRVLETIIRRLYSGRHCDWREDLRLNKTAALRCEVAPTANDDVTSVMAVLIDTEKLDEGIAAISNIPTCGGLEIVISKPHAETENSLKNAIERLCKVVQNLKASPRRLTLTWRCPTHGERHRTYHFESTGIKEQELLRNIHPEAARRLELWRLQNFHLERLAAHDRIYAFLGRGRTNPKDERIFLCAEVFGGANSEEEPYWEFEQTFFEGIRALREAQSRRTKRTRLRWNWMHFYVHSPVKDFEAHLPALANRLEPHTRGLSVREVNIRARVTPNSKFDPPKSIEVSIRKPGRYRLDVERVSPPSTNPLPEMSPYDMRVVRARRYGCVYPYEIIQMLEGGQSSNDSGSRHFNITPGQFQEYDLNDKEQLVAIDRDYGKNSSGVVIGIITNQTEKFPEGMSRVWIGSDPTNAMGALAEPECKRIIAAIDMAEEKGMPIEWIPISAGAKIAMDSGTENLDWTALVLRRIIEYTQNGGQINVVVHGINVGAQSYWNAEATMMMHTKGILIMTLGGSMVLTGKKALDFSGSVSAEDERGIGGAERIMSPNGQAQYVANDLGHAYQILFDYYTYSYLKKGDAAPRLSQSTDPIDRSILNYPYQSSEDFKTIGDIFDLSINPGRKKPFAIREVMRSVIDQDSGHLERFSALLDGESGVVWDAHVGSFPVCLIGIESRPVARRGRIPMDGPDTWNGGTLFPNSSRKIARAINSASGNRPVVALANLSGFDGSPESMRRLQLEMGAEIGRAVVNFKGPIIFVVVGRYHGGAYVVFSKALNSQLRALAVEGSYASVIGGAPAAAVVFPREVKRRVELDKRIVKMTAELKKSKASQRPMLREKLDDLRNEVTLEIRGDVAAEFDAIHSVHRAVKVGSLDAVIQPQDLRPRIISELESSVSAQAQSEVC